MFLGVVALDRQAEITELTLDIMAFFAERFDTIAGDFTLYVVANEEERIAKMEEVLGDTPPLQCGLAQGNVAFVQLWCANAIAHEYFHVLQEVWAPKAQVPASDTGWEWGAWWLFEGSAEYAEMRYFEMVNATDPDYYTRGLNTRERFMSFDPTPLRDLETYIPRFATTHLTSPVSQLTGSSGARVRPPWSTTFGYSPRAPIGILRSSPRSA